SHSEFVFFLSARESRSSFFDNKSRHPSRISFFSGSDNYNRYFPRNSMSNEVLSSVNHPIVTIFYSCSRHSPCIRACIVLCKSPSSNPLTASEFRDPFFLLFFVSES